MRPGVVVPTGRNRDLILAAIRDLSRERGFSPTVREIRRHTGIASTQTVQWLLDGLKRDGLVDWVPRTARTLRLVKGKK